jgi:hypothetical protein
MDDQNQEEYIYRVRKHLKEKFRKEEGRDLKRKFADAERVSTGGFVFALLFYFTPVHLSCQLPTYVANVFTFIFIFFKFFFNLKNAECSVEGKHFPQNQIFSSALSLSVSLSLALRSPWKPPASLSHSRS